MDKKILVIGVILIVSGFAVFWFFVRPANIKQECFAEAEFSKEAINEMDSSARQKNIDNYYKNCLRRRGVSD